MHLRLIGSVVFVYKIISLVLFSPNKMCSSKYIETNRFIRHTYIAHSIINSSKTPSISSYKSPSRRWLRSVFIIRLRSCSSPLVGFTGPTKVLYSQRSPAIRHQWRNGFRSDPNRFNRQTDETTFEPVHFKIANGLA